MLKYLVFIIFLFSFSAANAEPKPAPFPAKWNEVDTSNYDFSPNYPTDFEYETKGDFNGDGIEDIARVLQEPHGKLASFVTFNLKNKSTQHVKIEDIDIFELGMETEAKRIIKGSDLACEVEQFDPHLKAICDLKCNCKDITTSGDLIHGYAEGSSWYWYWNKKTKKFDIAWLKI